MEAKKEDIKIYGKLVNVTTENVVADAQQIWDSNFEENQQNINKSIRNDFNSFKKNPQFENATFTGNSTFGGDVKVNENFSVDGESNFNGVIKAHGLPSLSQVYYPGFTFVATDQGKRGNTASNVKIHVPSTATGYNESESDVWKWPGCFKATEGNNEVRYGNYKNQTLKLSSYPKDVQAINTWSIVRDYDSQNILYILYDRDPSTGAKKVQS